MLKISIITINYNNASGLKRTLDSIFDQAYPGFESIVIDGESNDDSVAIIRKFESRLAHWVSEQDTGPYEAMNKGIRASGGDYLLFLNSGDVFASEDALNQFVNHPHFHGDVIYGDYKFAEGGKHYPDTLSPYYFFKTSLPHQSTLFRRTVFEDYGLYDESYSISADRAWYLGAYLTGKYKFQHIPVALAQFDLTGRSNDQQYRAKKYEEDQRLFSEHFGSYLPDMQARLDKERELAKAKRNSLNGLWKRLKKRFKI